MSLKLVLVVKLLLYVQRTLDSFDETGKLDENSFACANSTSWGDDPIVVFESADGTDIYNAEDTIIANMPQGHVGHIYINLAGNPSSTRINHGNW